ncbi:MAG: response regulator transcription factor [Candidatus Helarchaeota archaeon]
MKSAKILIVDDERDTVLLAQRLLEHEGYCVISAYDGEEALQKIYTERPNLILLDVMLPKKNGYEVCKEIKANNELKNTIVVMFTVKKFDSDRRKGFQAGTDYYVTKPFSGQKLLTFIRKILQN